MEEVGGDDPLKDEEDSGTDIGAYLGRIACDRIVPKDQYAFMPLCQQ